MTFFRAQLAAWHHWTGQTLEERDSTRDKREIALLLAAVAFIFTNAIAYSLVNATTIAWPHVYAPLAWAGTILVAHLLLRALRPRRDPFLLPIFALLSGWGLLLQDRLAVNFLGRQTLWFVLATTALLLVAILPRTLQSLMRFRYSLLLGGLILLAISLLFGVNPSGSGAALWLPVPFPFWGTIYFQPSELLKLLLVVFLASYFTEQEPLYRYRKQMKSGNGQNQGKVLVSLQRHLPFLGPLFLMWGFTLLLLVWQQDLGAAALFFIVFVILLYLATGEHTYVLSGVLLLFLAGVIAFFAFDTVVAPRVLSWINPWPNVSDRAYQIVQALYAQAAGGFFGQGIGQGLPDFIPVVHSDFVLAAISEEWGLIGSLAVVACFATLAVRGLRVALLSIRGAKPRFFHAYLAAGVVALFSVQTFLIMGGVTRLLPLTGITLPFISYGGSSLLISSMAIGLLLYLSATIESASPGPSADPDLAQRIERLAFIILFVFGIIAITLTYWSVVRSDSLLAREDNPRLIENERRIQRGRIFDRHDQVLAESASDGRAIFRVYDIPESSPVVGYFSLRFGTAGIENAFNEHLRGQSEHFWSDTMRSLLHVPTVGADVRLTLDAPLQQSAAALFEKEQVTGGLVLLELTAIGGQPVAEVRVMASRPGFDPNQIDAEFEMLSADSAAPLLNRAAQGFYQPGLVLQPLIIAAAVDDGLIQMDDPLIDPFLPVTIDDQVLRCAQPRAEGDSTRYTWEDMSDLHCPYPLQMLGEQLGADGLQNLLSRFGLWVAPPLPIHTGNNDLPIIDPGLAAVGEDVLTISPLQAALAMAALSGDGRVPTPRLVEGLADAGGQWKTQMPAASSTVTPAISPDVAAAIRNGWPAVGEISTFSVSVLAGPDNARNAWLIGLAPAGNPRYVLAVALEGEADLALAEEIGTNLLAEALNSSGR